MCFEVIYIGKLYFYYGAMGSSKTANALMTRFNYEEKGYKVLLFKPSLDNRDGENIIKSRIGLSNEAILIHKDDSIINIILNMGLSISKPNRDVDCIVLDEGQFLSTRQIEELKQLASIHGIVVITYGLRTDFKSHLFEGSKRLMELADTIEEIKSMCHCGSKAIINARYIGDSIIYRGDTIDIGGNDKYIGLCYKCWINGKLR